MLSDAELNQFREERLADEQWRNISCHVIADMIEVCGVCGAVRDRERLVRCPWCEDCFCCKDGVCREQHRSAQHPSVAYWTW
ncbi:MAG TPA: hypothetical protein VL523_17990 [Terriglobia bacterium]|nr:hypothetical protein [Terriglobia bacterium]